MNKWVHLGFVAMISFSLLTTKAEEYQQGLEIAETPKVLSHRERVEPVNRILKHRLDHLLPRLMKESDLDMWLVINREYGEDALFYTLVPDPTFAARRTTLLVFAKKGNSYRGNHSRCIKG